MSFTAPCILLASCLSATESCCSHLLRVLCPYAQRVCFKTKQQTFAMSAGWYVANMTAAGPLTWARGTGCKLPTEGCKSMITPLYQEGLFCDAAAAAALPNPRYTCSASHRSVGQCRNVSFSNGCGMVLGRGGNPSCTMKEYEYANADVFGWTNGATSRCYPVTYKMSATLDGGRTLYVFPSTVRAVGLVHSHMQPMQQFGATKNCVASYADDMHALKAAGAQPLQCCLL